MNRALAALGHGLRTTFVGGTRLFVLAPVIPLLAIVPEFVQHVAEIRLGMFESREAFGALAMHPERWSFGYAKIAGFILAILAAARYWGGAHNRWWDLRGVAWGPFLIAFAVNAVVSVAVVAIRQRLAGTSYMVFEIAASIATLPLLLYLIGPLLGDRTMTLRRAYTGGWGRLVLMAVLLVVAFLPAQIVHGLNHTWALGKEPAVVWALMTWDAVLVGLMACWFGAALGAGYRSGEPDGDSDPSPDPLPVR